MVEDIELRRTKTTRLVFRPLLVDNAQDREAAVKGSFTFQRKRLGQDWEDYKIMNLSQLKAEEWVKLKLKSAEVLKLFQELSALYELYEQEGIQSGEVEYFRKSPGLDALLEATDEDLEALVQAQGEQASETLTRLLHWSLSSASTEDVLAGLEQLDSDTLQDLSSLAGLRTLRSCLEIWENNKENNDEEFWQKVLGNYAFVLSQVFSYPVVILEDKAYVGGKSIANTGGNLLDFLLQNEVTQNVILVEIKTPVTPLLGSPYRGIYNISKDISGALIQVLNYRYSLTTEYSILRERSDFDFFAFEPTCIVIIGNYRSQLENDSKKRSFELFRSQLRSVQLLTYDELFAKVKLLINLFEGNDSTSLDSVAELDLSDTPPEEDEIPF